MPTIRVDHLNLNVTDEGDGPPLLFVHGFPLDQTMWQAQLEQFSRSHRVIAPDLRGFGKSDVTAGAVEMHDFADDLAALLDALGVDEPIGYCGLSMGGYVGWQFLKRYGQRVRSLILCDTRAAADTPEAIAGRMKLAGVVIEKGAAPAAEAMLPKLLAEQTRRQRPDLVEKVRRMIVQTDPESIAAALRGMANRADMTHLLAEINVPTLVIVGREDALSPPAEMRELAGSIAGATFVEIANAGHMAPLENSQAVNEAIGEFLKSIS